MDRREFALAAGGFKLMDPREAIKELHKAGMSQVAIADVLGVDRQKTVSRVLAEAGMAELPAYLAGGRSASDHPVEIGRSTSGAIDSTAEEVNPEVDRLTDKVGSFQRQVGRPSTSASEWPPGWGRAGPGRSRPGPGSTPSR